ncbi:MAG TPA: hypothetical protein VFV65_05355 [Gemmatimonadales bacterium]|nr:hypothetical protein [Gemmatimonadales bacterium]
MTDTIAVFVNERRVLVPRGATASVAAGQADPAPGGGPAAITDARGLPVSPDTVLTPGAILRVAASARRGGADADR